MTVDEMILELEILTSQGYGDCLIVTEDFTWGITVLRKPTLVDKDGYFDTLEENHPEIKNHTHIVRI